MPTETSVAQQDFCILGCWETRPSVRFDLRAATNPEDIELDEPAEDDEEADAEADAVVQQVCSVQTQLQG